ncbi:hypothetical protein CH373_15240 [Leptospira perolatii]|uniref:Uncharacterized protein n=1 Tax=Leptospira perolatii TaxID=2023191 RepID=A0A2M9ZJP4_9LEPT|nr:hypothetical protein [Leptospira perolatii]PJZ69450.1 hypothetical protein CH360_10580 [Leptospira perolatii]PJZ72275.1 hypothetical protein CH373_15240 [Leptospira perolatii]
MSKVFRIFRFVFTHCIVFFSIPVFASETKLEWSLDRILEILQHPILLEERKVKEISQQYYQNLRNETEDSILAALESEFDKITPKTKELSPSAKLNLAYVPALGGLSVEKFLGIPFTYQSETTDFPASDGLLEFQTKKALIRYYFKSVTNPYLNNWKDLGINGDFFLFSNRGALLLCKTTQEGIDSETLDIREIRSRYQTLSKKNSDVDLIETDETILFYFPNQSLKAFYVLLTIKILLVLLSIFIIFQYGQRFWNFLEDQRKRSLKAQARFLKDRKILESESESSSDRLLP